MENSEYSNALSIGRTYSFKIRAQKYERRMWKPFDGSI